MLRSLYLSCVLAVSCLSMHGHATAAEEKTILTLTVADVGALNASFASSPLGKLLWHPRLQGLRDYCDTEIKRSAFIIDELKDGVQAIQLRVFVTGRPYDPIGFDLQLDGDFVRLSENAKGMLNGIGQDPELDIAYDAEHIVFSRLGTAVTHEIEAGAGIRAWWSIEAAQETLLATQHGNEKDIVRQLLDRVPSGTVDFTFNAEGLSTLSHLDAMPIGLQPIDLEVLQQLPLACTSFMAIGFNGAAWWQQNKSLVIDIMAAQTPGPITDERREQAEMQLNMVSAMIIGSDVGTLLQGIEGTVMLAFNEPIFMYPNITAMIPRSTELDALITRLLAMGQVQAPVENKWTFLSLKNLNPMGGDLTLGALCVGRNASHWVLSMDSHFTETYLQGTLQPLQGRPFFRQLDNPQDICYFSTIDSSEQMAVLIPHALGGVANVIDKGRHGEALAMTGHHLSALIKPMLSIGRIDSDGKGFSVRSSGVAMPLSGNVAIIAVIASIAIPSLMESKVTANEAATAATLKSAIFPSQITFQAAGYHDPDMNGTGGYGFIEYLTGAVGIGNLQAGELKLLTGDTNFRGGRYGYRYEMYLPSGKNSAVTLEDGYPTTAEGIEMSENHYVVYAIPAKINETGRKVFAMTEDGQVYVMPAGSFPGGMPAWNALWDGGNWGDAPTWNLYNR